MKVLSNVEELIMKSEERGYINIVPTDYGFKISIDNDNLKSLIINHLKKNDSYDLTMWNWAKYYIGVFSCEVFNDYCENIVGDAEKRIIPYEIRNNGMITYMLNAFEKFNACDYDYMIKDGWIINRKVYQNNLKRQNEINEFVRNNTY